MIASLILLQLLLLATAAPTPRVVGEAFEDVIIENGGKFYHFTDAEVGGLATARIPRSLIEALEREGAAVHKPRLLKPTLDLSTAEIGASVLANLTGLNAAAVDGRNVLIAFVDTGVDYRHPAFKSKQGKNRILYIWDQTLDGRKPEGFGYGHECLPQEIADGSCPQRDTVGHGTIIASIAAGEAYGEWRMRGVAPGAELIVVKSGGPACADSRWFFTEKGLMDGVAYAVEKARSLGRRLVVVLSVGTDIGGHDGNTPLEKALDKWAEEGVVFAVAAGNSAAENRHAVGVLTPGRNTTISWTIPPSTTEASLSLVLGPEDEFDLYTSSPGGATTRLNLNQTTRTSLFQVETLVWRRSGLTEVLLDFTFQARSTGTWKLTISPKNVKSGVWNAWVETNTCSNQSEAFLPSTEYSLTSESTLTIPGTARKVLTVGAYTTRTQWQAAGTTWNAGGVAGGLEYYSGRGPTTDGRVKPDIAAPGGVIMGARSGDSGQQIFSPSSLVAVGRGTSMATPHAAGVSALVLQLAPHLTAEQVIMVVKGNARVDSHTGRVPATGSNSWGWGKLNADIAYTLNITVSGVADGVKLAVVVNNTDSYNLPASEARLVLLKKTITNISLRTAQAEDVRHIITPPSITAFGDLGKASFNIRSEYRLRILSPDGGLLKELWGPEKSMIRLSEVLKNAQLGGVVAGYLLDGVERRGDTVELTRPMTVVVITSRGGEGENILIVATGLLLTLTLATVSAVLVRSILKRRTSASAQ